MYQAYCSPESIIQNYEILKHEKCYMLACRSANFADKMGYTPYAFFRISMGTLRTRVRLELARFSVSFQSHRAALFWALYYGWQKYSFFEPCVLNIFKTWWFSCSSLVLAHVRCIVLERYKSYLNNWINNTKYCFLNRGFLTVSPTNTETNCSSKKA